MKPLLISSLSALRLIRLQVVTSVAIASLGMMTLLAEGSAYGSAINFQIDPSLRPVDLSPALLGSAKRLSGEALDSENKRDYKMALYKYEQAIRTLQVTRKTWYSYYLLGSAELDAARMHLQILRNTGSLSKPQRAYGVAIGRWWDAPKADYLEYVKSADKSLSLSLASFPLANQSRSNYQVFDQIRLRLATAKVLMGDRSSAIQDLDQILNGPRTVDLSVRVKAKSLEEQRALWQKRGTSLLRVGVELLKVICPKYGFLGEAVYTLATQWQ